MNDSKMLLRLVRVKRKEKTRMIGGGDGDYREDARRICNKNAIT